MEQQLKQPTQPRKISEADQTRINNFREFMLANHADALRAVYLRIYFEFSQAVTRDGGAVVGPETSGDLYYLQCLIELLG